MRGYSCLILVHSRTATVQVRNWNFSLGLTPGLDALPCAVFPLTRSRGFDLQQPDGEIQALLTELRSGLPYYAWTAFLTTYSGLIYGVIHMFAHEPDHTADCFLFVCEKLAENNYRRILAFKPDGKARFTTWARAVVRNLCLDWHRSQFGRKQVFSSVAARSGVDQEIFRAAFHRKDTITQIWAHLSKNGCQFSYADVKMRFNDL